MSLKPTPIEPVPEGTARVANGIPTIPVKNATVE